MADNVVQFHPKRNEERRQGEEATRKRLSEADQIRDKLRSFVRLPEPADKERLARNLGRMVEEVAQTKSHRLSIVRKLFAHENSEEHTGSLLKKRTRYIRFSDEPTADAAEPGKFAANGRQFVQLAEAFANLAPGESPLELKVQRAMLMLAEGTSFDGQSAARSRIKEGGTQEYIARMEEVLSIVQKQVDLPRYFDAIAQTQLSPNYLQNRARWNEFAQNFPAGDPVREYVEPIPTDTENGEWRLMSASEIAPQTAIGHLYIPRPIGLAIPVVLGDEYDSSKQEIPLRKRLEQALIATYGKSIAKDAAKMKYRSEFHEKYARAGHELLERILRLSPYWTRSGLWDRLDLVLTVERERSTEKPKLFLGCQLNTDSLEFELVTRIGDTFQDDSKAEGGDIWNWLVPVGVPFTNCYVLVNSSSSTKVDDPDELFFRTLKISSQKGLSLAFHKSIRPSQYHRGIDFMSDFNYSGEWILRHAIHDASGQYVPVPNDSIAGAILRNLAYAPCEKRLDTLLVEDARRKIAHINSAMEIEKEKYFEAISRLGEV